MREVGREGQNAHPRAMRPTVVLGVTDDMTIAHDEIFGPILPVFTYHSIAEAITFVDARPRPLALYYYGHDKAGQRQVLDGTTSGDVTINGTIMHIAQDDLPFGGVGASGIGAAPRAIWQDGRAHPQRRPPVSANCAAPFFFG